MQNFISLKYITRVSFDVSTNFPDNPRIVLKFIGYALQLHSKSTPFKPLLDIHDVCLHIIYSCDDIMYPVRYLPIG